MVDTLPSVDSSAVRGRARASASFVVAIAAVVAAACARLAGAQTASPMVVTASFPSDRYVAARAPIVLTMSQAPATADSDVTGTVAILLGSTDVTALFERHGDQWVYRTDVFALPSGESDLVVYLVNVSGWTEVSRFPIKVLTPRGFTKSTISPAASVNDNGQLAEGQTAGQPAPERPTFQDLQLATGFQSSQIKGDWMIESHANAIGVTNRRQALRFGERGDRAPRFDLSDYQVRVQRGAAKLSLGNVSLGTNRHLMSGFASRGLTLDVGSPAVALSVGAMGGSPTVGWDDPLGFTRASHRVLGSTLALEMRPRRPGAFHVDFTLVDGSLLPRAGFTQNAVTDAERSTGVGMQFSTSTPQQRLRVAGGISESRFVNPSDPLLDGTLQTTHVGPTRKMARYLETSVVLLQNTKIVNVLTNLTANLRHERVDPLFRSVTAFTRADALTNGVDANATIGVVALQASHLRSSDNLAHVASLLTTDTRATTTQVTAPLAALLHTTSRWIPAAAYAFNQTHQFGVGIPTNAGFAAENVPDQVSTVHDASLQWQPERWRAGYRFNRSFQDNRQPGHEKADLSVSTNAVTLGLTAWRTADVGIDLSTERQVNLEQAMRGTVQRLGFTTNWRPAVGTGIATTFTASRNADAPRTQRAGNTELRVELSRALALGRRAQQGARAQAFMRYARQSANTTQFLQPLFPQPPLSRAAWTISSGVNFLVF
jgi:hypothetical protein